MHHLRDQFETNKVLSKKVYYYVFVFVHEVKLSEIDIFLLKIIRLCLLVILGTPLKPFVFEIPF